MMNSSSPTPALPVYYIFAKTFTKVDREFGLPSFDPNKNLIGFYKQGETFRNTTNITVPLFEYVNRLTDLLDSDVQTIVKRFEYDLSVGHPKIFCLSNYNRLVDMVEAAIIEDMCETYD